MSTHPAYYDGCDSCKHAYTHEHTQDTGGICTYAGCPSN